MASVTKYKTPKGVRWRVQYTDPSRKRRTKTGFVTKKQAEHWAAENIIERNTGSWIDPDYGRITVKEIHAQWVKRLARAKPHYRRQNESTWRNHVEPQWGSRQIGDITKFEVQQWVDSINRAGSTVRIIHGQLLGILSHAVEAGYLKVNPAQGVRLPSKSRPRKTYLTPAQLKRLADESGHPELVMLLGTAGLRWGEAVALRPKDISFTKRRIYIDKSATRLGGRVELVRPKTGEEREVTAPASVMGAIRRLCEGVGRDSYIWAAGDGMPMGYSRRDSGWLQHAVERCQATDSEFPDITAHGLRHVAAGLLIGSGASVKAVQRQLGHATAAMTLDQYADLFEGDLDHVARAMDRLFV